MVIDRLPGLGLMGKYGLLYHTYLIPQRCDLKDAVAIAIGNFLRQLSVPKLLSVHDDDEPMEELQTESKRKRMRRTR